MKTVYFFVALLFLSSCFQENHYESNNDELLNKIDSLQKKVSELQKEIVKPAQKDTIFIHEKTIEKKAVKTEAKPNREKIIHKPILPQKRLDSIVHFFKDGKKSVI
ncbi:MAG: hypothetical protein ACO3EE_06290 [Flavobacteriales bacterium]